MKIRTMFKNALHFFSVLNLSNSTLLFAAFFSVGLVQSSLQATGSVDLNHTERSQIRAKCFKGASQRVIDQRVKAQRVEDQCVKEQQVVESKINKIETDELFVDGQKISPSNLNGGFFPITGSTTIVGENFPRCGDCPIPTPGTPSGGVFALQNSFSGKVVFCGVKGMELDLRGFSIDGDSDVTLEFINCDQVWVHGGSVNNLNGTAIKVSCSSMVCLSRINTTNTEDGFIFENSYDVQAKNIFMDSIAGTGISFDLCNYIRLNSINISGITEYHSDSLIAGTNSGMIFMNNMALYGISVEDVSGTMSVIKLDKCLDVKISHISILSTQFIATPDMDLNVYLVHITNSGSMILGSFIIDGDFIEVSGCSKGVLNCLRLEDGNNTFMAHHLMTDNHVNGDILSTDLVFEGIHISRIDTLTLNGSKICTNYVQTVLEADCQNIQVRSFYGEEYGNWFLSGNICNENYTNNFQSGNASVYGFEVFDVQSTVIMQNCSANGHGEVFVSESGGFKIHALDSNHNTTAIVLDNCAANQNISARTTGFLSTYSNTLIHDSESIFNVSQGDCVGFLFDGNDSGQSNVNVIACVSNNNVSFDKLSYGLKSRSNINLNIANCTFNENTYGMYLQEVNASSLAKNHLTGNQLDGLYIKGGSHHGLFRNSALANACAGFRICNSSNSIIKENLSQGNQHGFVDTSQMPSSENSYFTNNAVGNTFSSYENVTSCVVPWFKFNPSSGTFDPVQPAGTVLSAFSNLSS